MTYEKKETVVAELIKEGAGFNFRTLNKNPIFVKCSGSNEREGIDLKKILEHEYKVVQRLQKGGGHPGLNLELRFTNEGGFFEIAYKFLEGESLKAYLDRTKLKKKPHAELIIDCGRDIADILSYMHKNGVIHGDVKPGNIMMVPRVDEKDVSDLILLDFGLSAVDGKMFERQTYGTFFGTPQYVAPEIEKGDLSEQADIYSLGVILYELATENPLQKWDYYGAILDGSIIRDKPDIRRHDLPQELKDIIYKAVALKKRDRFETAEEMRDALIAVERLL